MRLYAGPSSTFIQDSVHNRIASTLESEFLRQYRYTPSPGEVQSWHNSLRAVSQVFADADLMDHGVLLEYQLPLTSKRLDCMICGHDEAGAARAVVIELKQWQRCEASDVEDAVLTWVGGNEREVLHPSAQVTQYRRYLADTHTAFYEGEAPIGLESCAYLHNYQPQADDPLYDSRYAHTLAESPSYAANQVPRLQEFLSAGLAGGDGMPVLDRIEKSRYRPSRKLLEHVANVIAGRPEYVLLDEQYLVYRKVLALAEQALEGHRSEHGKRHVLLIHGGPGTGKSVIAMNLMGALAEQDTNVHYATGSKAFTTTLRKIIGKRGESLLRYFNNYGQAGAGEVDVLICDEAHRIRKTSANRFTPKHQQTGLPQIEELLRASKLAVFFVDDFQTVRPGEIGSSPYIKASAEDFGAKVLEYRLSAQFRCGGSDGFIQWVNNTLELERTPTVMWPTDQDFDFRIFPDPQSLDDAIRARHAEGTSARMTAGYCWEWSKTKAPDGGLVKDVVIGDYQRPWNARPELTRLPPGIPKAELWAYHPGGIDQVGCVYTAQGFEFDYVGVIFGRDLRYDLDAGGWIGDKTQSHDHTVRRSKEHFIDFVKNTYRVLLTRGMKGCYVCFLDKDTERFVRSRMEGGVDRSEQVTTRAQKSDTRSRPGATRRPESTIPAKLPRSLQPIPTNGPGRSENAIPIVSLSEVEGEAIRMLVAEDTHQSGSGTYEVAPASILAWVEAVAPLSASPGSFAAQVNDPTIDRSVPRGSWCLFGPWDGELCEGDLVLADTRENPNACSGSDRWVVRRVQRDRRKRQESFLLVPDGSLAEGIEAIRLQDAPSRTGSKNRIVARLLAILS